MADGNKKVTKQFKGMSDDRFAVFVIRAAMRELPLRMMHKRLNSKVLLHYKEKETLADWKPRRKSQYLLGEYLKFTRLIECVLDKNSDIAHATLDKYANIRVTLQHEINQSKHLYKNFYDHSDSALRTFELYHYLLYGEESIANFEGIKFGTGSPTIDIFFGDVEKNALRFPLSLELIAELKADWETLNNVSAVTLLMQPLWSQTIPNAWQNKLANFKNDALSLDAGFEVWQDWYDDRLLGNPIDLELLKNWNRVPSEIASQSVAEVNAYIKNLKDKVATQPLNRVRAIFIGYGEAGKTSLVRALHDEPVVVGKELMTPGIDIRDWPVPDSDIQAHFWDFGGQVMAHSTHQFFLRSSCLYVLVLNARNEINGTEQAEYWLEHVKGFGNNAPVMIVGNKSDLASINLDMSYLKSKYPNIVDLYPVSCTQAKTHYKSDFDRFKRDFCQKLQEVGTHQMLFTEHQFSVLKALRQCSAKDAFLKHQEFENICTQYGIGTEGVQNREWLLDILDKLGVVIHFPQLAFLDDYVLNPRWLTYGVYTLMYSKQAKLDEFQIVRFLNLQQITDEAGNALNYPKDKCRFIMEAMKEFKLCYPLQGERNTLIIPELLPTDQPEPIPFDKVGALAFEFVFRGFLPRHVMPELIVNRHEEIVQQIVWQRGVLLKHKIYHAQALLQVDYHERVLSIWVNGRDARDYLGLLNDEVLKILKRLDLDYKEWITLPIPACISDRIPIEVEEKAPYRQILACARKGERVYISEAGLEYDLNQILGIILSDDEQERAGVTQIFNGDVGEINVSKQSIKIGDKNKIGGSVVAAEKIENSFNSLQESKADIEVKTLLEQLLNEIKALNGKVPDSQAQQFADMAEGAETLITETGRKAPRPKWYQLSLEGIKEAALAVGEVAKPVLEIAEKIAPLLQ